MKHFTTSDYNKFTVEILNAKIKEKGLVDKSDISGFIDNSDLDSKIATLATEAELKSKQDELVKRQSFDSSYFRGKIILKIMEHRIIWYFNQGVCVSRSLLLCFAPVPTLTPSNQINFTGLGPNIFIYRPWTPSLYLPVLVYNFYY